MLYFVTIFIHFQKEVKGQGHVFWYILKALYKISIKALGRVVKKLMPKLKCVACIHAPTSTT